MGPGFTGEGGVLVTFAGLAGDEHLGSDGLRRALSEREGWAQHRIECLACPMPAAGRQHFLLNVHDANGSEVSAAELRDACADVAQALNAASDRSVSASVRSTG